jgi:hypothetical protein
MNNSWEINNLQQRLDRLENDASRRAILYLFWLMMLSNLLFWGFIAHASLKRDVNKIIQQQELRVGNNQPTKKIE